jgi:glycosyltransferase involved in cell wall biosynthesis
MLRIVIDVRRVRDFGIGTYIRNLVYALGALDGANRYVLVVGPDDKQILGSLPKNFEPALYRGNDRDYGDNIALPLFLRRFAPDLVHIPLNRVPLALPRPYVVTIHDMSSLMFDQHPGFRRNLHRYRFRLGLKRADRVIAVSEATSRDVQNILGVPPERIRVVYNAPDPKFLEHRPVADARLPGPESHEREKQRILERYQVNYPFVLYAGNIRPQKNIPRLVEAFAVVRAGLAAHPKYKDLRLIIIGDEITRHPALRRAVIQSRVEQAVRFLGFVPFDTLRCFYEAAEVFAFPSLYEGFGLPPLEAMASGTPVVTSAVSSLPEVVDDAAVQVNPENVFDIARGLREVLLDDGLRERLIRRGKEQVSRFSWARAAREVLEIYREVGGGS